LVFGKFLTKFSWSGIPCFRNVCLRFPSIPGSSDELHKGRDGGDRGGIKEGRKEGGRKEGGRKEGGREGKTPSRFYGKWAFG
jgi:hypothetical protein